MRKSFLISLAGLTMGLAAEEIQISDVLLDELGNLQMAYSGEENYYYILARGRTIEEVVFAVDAQMGQLGSGFLADPATDLSGSFYQIFRVPLSQPYDTDGDGINDVQELNYPSFLNPLDPADAALDFDRDGVSNLDEILSGRDPTAFDGVQIFSPLSGRVFPHLSSIPITVESGPGIDSVEFYEGETLIGTDTDYPFFLNWETVSSGDYVLTVVGYAGGQDPFTSKPVPVSVHYPPAQFSASSVLTNQDSVTVSGTVGPGFTVTISGGLEVVGATADGSGLVSVQVPLIRNRENRLFAVVRDSNGRASAPVPLEVIQDSIPPNLFIDFPEDGAELALSTATIAGRVGDLLSGHEGLQVDVQSMPAEVIIGIGQNGTFERANVGLSQGLNVIRAVATDAAGNQTSKQITVKRIDTRGPRLSVLSGDGQIGQMQFPLSSPLLVRILKDDNTPVANKLVTYEIIRSDGLLKSSISSSEKGGQVLQAYTDLQGVARAWLTLGTDAGCGNNRVKVTSRDVAGTAYFTATALPGPASQINIGSGNRLKVEAGAMAQEALRVWVSDSCNGVGGIPVTFTVIQGGGLVNGQASTVVDTAVTGHAEVRFQLGPEPGNNVVQADFEGNAGIPAKFVIEGVGRDPNLPTTWSGLVLDNSRQPIGGVRVSLEIEGEETWSAITGTEGTFRLLDIPDGPARLIVDGWQATERGGLPLPERSFPSLYFEVMVIPNANNSLPGPILLPRLDPDNERFYDGTEDVVMEVAGMAGLRMVVAAGSMTRPDGTKPSPDDPAYISLNQVHHDDVPMPMPDGAAPPFAWTLQPLGSTFDPPIRIEYPNMSSLQPGAVAYFLSYNHDTERFEIIASGHVTRDGSTIVTDEGVGLTLAGWGCNCPPYSVAADCEGEGTVVKDPGKDPPQTGTRPRGNPEDDPGPNPGDCFTYCFDYGEISMGSFTNPSPVKCVGDLLTFNGPSFTDSGGSREEKCRNEDGSVSIREIPIPSVPVSVSWTIRRNGQEIARGQGREASIVATQTGTYTCSFTGEADRDCPPLPVSTPGLNALVVAVASVSGGGITSTSESIGPSNTVVVCKGAPGERLTLDAASTVGSFWPPGMPVWTGATGNGATATIPVDVVSADSNGTIVTAQCGQSRKSLRVIVVEPESVSGAGVTSTTNFPGESETIYVCQGKPGETIGLSATSRPGNVWPAGEPTWVGATGIGASATFPIDTVSATPTGSLVSVQCGSGSISIGVVVVGVESLETRGVVSATDTPGDMETVRVCREAKGNTITITAKPSPGMVWPNGSPTWENATPTGDGTTATFPIDTVSADAEGTIVRARCGESVQAIRIVVYNIEKVEWIPDVTPLTGNPNPGGGLRIFAEKPTPTADYQDTVIARATITPVIENADVYFRLIDVDDPSSNDPDLDDESLDLDNFGGIKFVPFGPHKTDAAGQASVQVAVSHQPGDNYRMVAECWPDSNFIIGVKGRQNDGFKARVVDETDSFFIPANHVSPLLTVWRTLHFEEDSMGPVDPEKNRFVGRAVRINSNGKGSAVTNLEVDRQIDGNNDGSIWDGDVGGRYHNGSFTLGDPVEHEFQNVFGTSGNPSILSFGTPFNIVPLSFSAVDNDSIGNSTFSGAITEIEAAGSSFDGTETFTLHLDITSSDPPAIDWPDFVGGTVVMAGGDPVDIVDVDSVNGTVTVDRLNIPLVLVDDDQAVLPYSLDYSDFVSRVFGEAYLKVVVDGGGDPANNKYNLTNRINWPEPTEAMPITESDTANLDALLDLPGGLESDGNRSNGYWIAHVLWGYQPGTVEDNDPHKEESYYGVVPSLGGRGTFMPLEICLDGRKPGDPFPINLVKEVVCHEVGHQFGLDHEIMMMHATSIGNRNFSPKDLMRIRSRPQSPGKR